MSNFSCASNSTNENSWLRGLSYTPNVQGPNGSGSPGSATTVKLVSVTVGCPTLAAAGEAPTCYVYSAPLDDPTDIGTPTNLVATSTSKTIGSAFGSGTHSTTYAFSNQLLAVSAVYYVYVSADKSVCVDNGNPYTGGTAYDIYLDDDGTSAQFIIQMTT